MFAMDTLKPKFLASLMNLLLKVMKDGVNFAPSLVGYGKGNDPQEAFSD
jgi:hypothetical protein